MYMKISVSVFLGFLLLICVKSVSASNGKADMNSTGPSYFEVHFENNCSDKVIYIAVHYKDIEGAWVTSGGWWSIDYKQTVKLPNTKLHYVYFYATNDSGVSWEGKKKIKVSKDSFLYPYGRKIGGDRYVFFKKQMIQNTVLLNCD